MQWTVQMSDAVNYIEEHLDDDIDNDKIAQITCCSYDNFQRIFSFVFGISLAEYIRYRRLTLSAIELQKSDARIIDIAIKYGYASHEAFSRAFIKFHGVSPKDVKKENVSFRHCSKALVSMTTAGSIICYSNKNLISEESICMKENGQPKIEKRQFKLVGINKFVKWGDDFEQIIKTARAELQSYISEINNIVNPSERIQYFYSETGMQDGFNFLQCVEVKDISNIPDGLISRSLIESEYAVFITDEGKGGDYARSTWLPQSEYEENHGVFGDLEVINIDKNTCEFWLPILRKK